jgi:hypothetical protein
MKGRLERLLGPLAPWLLRPGGAASLCAAGWLLLLPLCWGHPLMAALAWGAAWALLMALRLEAPLLQGLPLPPLTVLLLGLALRWGLGPLLMAVGGSGDDAFLSIWIRYGPPAQLLWLVFTAALLAWGLCQRRSIARAAASLPSAPWLVALREPGQERARRQLAALAVVLSVYMGLYVLLSVLSGAFDRQFAVYASWTRTLWRLDTPVAAFSRLRDLWLVLLPLWWRLLQTQWRLPLGGLMAAFVGAALLSGSRGLLFYPALLVLLGLWFVISDPRWMWRLGLALAVLVLVLSPAIVLMRESPAFESAPDWQARARAAGAVLMRPEPLLQKARWLGRDLYACHDPYLFTPENRVLPRVGAAGLERLPYLWLPRHLMPQRPVLFDGHLIAKQLQRIQPSAWSQVWFPCLSLPADLFRRWHWPGVVLGSALVAGVVQILMRLWYRQVALPGTSFQLLLLVYPASYLQSFPFGTVSETCWALFWELPKYLLVLWGLGKLVDRWLDWQRAGRQ